MIKQKRDDNELEIIAFLRKVGAYVQKMDRSAGHDLTVVFRGVVYLAEIKNGPKGWHLTRDERRTCEGVERIGGGCYHILTSIEDAMQMIGV